MYTSDRFQKELQKAKKERPREDLYETLEARFLRHLPQLPSELGQELFSHCYRRWEAGAGDFIFGDILDLMQQQYDEDNDPLSEEDWETVRDIVSSYAVELDMQLVTYVMRKVVDHGHS